MTPGHLSFQCEFTLVSSHGSTFVYMIPPQSVMLGESLRREFTLVVVPGPKISLWYEISQRYHVNAKQPHISV